PLFEGAAMLAVTLKDPAGYGPVRQFFLSTKRAEAKRLQALAALIAGGDDGVEDLVRSVLADTKLHTVDFRGKVVTTLGQSDGSWVGALLLGRYGGFE